MKKITLLLFALLSYLSYGQNGETCATAIDLGGLTSPYSGTTVGAANDNLTACNNSSQVINNTYGDLYFSILIPDGSTLRIGQTVNNYDSTNKVFYGDCSDNTLIACWDDSDTLLITWANTTGADQTVYWVQDGHSGTGTFTLAWSVIACSNPVATYSVSPLCDGGNQQFEVITYISSLGSATSLTVSDNQGNSEVVTETGLVVTGPYNMGTAVTMTVANSDDADCTLTSSALNLTACPTVANYNCANAIDLGGLSSPFTGTTVGSLNTNMSICNSSGTSVANTTPDVWYFIEVPAGSTLRIQQTSNSYDSANVVFYGSCINRTVIDCFDDPDEKLVTWANNTGSDQTVYWIQDAWTGSGTFTLEWSVIACTQPVATFAVNSLCSGGTDEFEVLVNISSLGSADSLTVSDNQGNDEIVTEVGPVTLGPYSNNTAVVITVLNDQDSDCQLVSSTLNQLICPPMNTSCALATNLGNLTSPITATTTGSVNSNTSICNTSGAATANTTPDVWYFINVPAGSTLTIEQTVNSYDSANVVFYGSCDDRHQIACFDDPDYTVVTWPNNTGADQDVYWIQDAYTGSGTFTLQWSVIACTQAAATFSTNSLCSGGNDEFEVITNITNMGSATSLTVSDSIGNEQIVTEVGPVVFGPYANNTPVVITILNDQDTDCFLTSATLNQISCPPDNDNADGAYILTLDEATSCGPNAITGISNAATTASPEIAPTCTSQYNPVPGNGDIWFKFEAPSSEVTLNVTSVVGISTVSGELYSGTPGNLSPVGACGNAWPKNYTTLTQDEVYYLRLWDYGNDNIGTFTLCGYYKNCTNPAATYQKIVDCDLDPTQFTVNVDVTNMGSAESLTLTDNQGSSVEVTSTGIVEMGPYPLNTPVIFTLTNDVSPICFSTSATQNVIACPPSNDNCSGAIALIPGTVFADNAVDATVAGATNSAVVDAPVPAPGCASYAGGDVWFSVEIPAGGAVTVETFGSQGISTFDSGMAAYSGSCGNLTLITCDDDGADTGLFSRIALTGRQPGEIVYIRVWEYSNDETEPFSVSAFHSSLGVAGVDAQRLAVYPNPVRDYLTVSNASEIQTIGIYNLLGQQLSVKTVNAKSDKLDMSQLPQATYLVRVTAETGTRTIKVVKQ
jgi:hypothetical protein